MTTIFVSHAQANADCAETIRRELEAKGYTVFRETGYPGPGEASYPRMIENAILGSAVVVLVWSSAAEQDEWVERHIHFAQRLKKLLLPVVLDSTALPNTLIVETVLPCQLSCHDTVPQLLLHLPQPDSTEPLIQLSEQAAHEFIHIRRTAIDQAAVMLQRGEHRDEVLALLEYLANHDLMMGVRDKAKETVEADMKRAAPPSPPPFLHLGNPRDIFGVRCKKGHVTYFNKWHVCPAKAGKVARIKDSAGKKLDELVLTCDTCGEEMAVLVECEGYK
jgi:hypothetical protein